MTRSWNIRPTLLALGWIASLLGVALLAQETPAPERPREVRPFMQSRGGALLSGDDVGIRVTGQANGVAYGVLVVRLNGEWVEVAGAPRLTPAR